MNQALSRGDLSLALTSAETDTEGRQWVHLLPSGTFAGRDGRQPYTIADAMAVIEASRKYAGTREIPIDYEHQTQRAVGNGQPAPAAGWIDALQSRDNGIWGRVRWTQRAASYLAGREYRYFSPTFYHSDDGVVRMIIGGGPTNVPALPQLIALARTETPAMDKTAGAGTLDAFLAELIALLGLPADADQAAVVAKVKEALAQCAIDPAKFVPIGTLETMVSEVNKLNQGISHDEATRHVAIQMTAGNLPPALKDWGISLCTVNKVAFDAFVERTRGGFNTIVDRLDTRRMHRATASTSPLSEDERAVCTRMAIGEDDYLKARAFTENGKA